MENLILGWYVLVATNSVFLLTVFGALQFIGTLLSPYFGMLADRVSRRGLLIALRAAYGACALVLAALELAGLLAPWHVFVIALVSGLLRPSDLVVRNSLIADTVPAGLLTNAMGLSRTTMDSARIVGTLAGAGLFSMAGFGAAYLVVTLFYAASMALSTGIARGTLRHAGGAWSELKLGIRYIAQTPTLAAMMCFAFLVNLTAYPLSHGLLPYVARDIYAIDANGLAHLMASFSLGALAGSLWLAWSGRTANALRLMLAGIYCWYVLMLVFAQFESKLAGLAAPGDGRSCAEPLDGLDVGGAASAHRDRLPRPGDGRAHAGGLRPAGRIARGGRLGRSDRLRRPDHAVCACRTCGRNRHRLPLARRPARRVTLLRPGREKPGLQRGHLSASSASVLDKSGAFGHAASSHLTPSNSRGSEYRGITWKCTCGSTIISAR